MANRNSGSAWNRNRGDFGRGYEQKSFTGRPLMNPWQGNMNPSNNVGGNILPLSSVQSDTSALALANNLIALLGQRNNVPSLLDMPPLHSNYGNFDRGYGEGRSPMGRMGKQGPNFNRRGQLPPRRSGPVGNNRPSGNTDRNKTPKKTDSATKPADSTENAAEGNGDVTKTEDGQVTTTKFDIISSEFLCCHICDKRMWDGRSFQNHLNGRAHNTMMAKTKESYALTADAVRNELKIFEMKRMRRSNERRNFYCAMCDLYVADGPTHRTSIGHRRLKKYLHPACLTCRKEMSTRIEFDEHRLTLQHLQVLQERSKGIPRAKESMIVYTLQQELAQVRLPKPAFRRKTLKKEEVEKEAKTEDGEKVVKTEEGESEEKVKAEDADVSTEVAEIDTEDIKEEEKAEEKEPPVPVVLDLEEGKDVSEVKEENVPSYNPEVCIGMSFIGDFSCKHCNLCDKLLDTDETAEVHLKTWKHYKNFITLLREKAGLIIKKEAAPKRNPNDNDDSNFKRRKTEQGDDETNEDDETKEGDEMDTSTNEPDGDKLAELLEEQMKGDSDWDKIDEMVWQDQDNEDTEEQSEEATSKAVTEQKVVEVAKVEKEPVNTPRARRGRSKKN